MAYNTILIEKKDMVAFVTLNRPEKLNSINFEMKAELLQLLDELESDDGVRVVVVTGAGRAFCAGGDIGEYADVSDWRRVIARGLNFNKRIYEFEKPVIGAINGVASGDGAHLALAFDINIASEKAKFAWPATRLGILCPYGLIRLPKEFGRFKAKDLLMTARYLSAEEACQWGLVSRVVSQEKLMDAAMGLADEIKKMPPLSIKAIKQAVNRDMDGYEYAYQVMVNLTQTEDSKEGTLAFIQKREPNFQGK